MSILYLTLKAKFYDMIESGIKPEEYREIREYWIKRLGYRKDGTHDIQTGYAGMIFDNDFTHVRFARGGHFHPSVPQMTFELEDIDIGFGQEKWGAEPGKKYFVIKLGERDSTV